METADVLDAFTRKADAIADIRGDYRTQIALKPLVH